MVIIFKENVLVFLGAVVFFVITYPLVFFNAGLIGVALIVSLVLVAFFKKRLVFVVVSAFAFVFSINTYLSSFDYVPNYNNYDRALSFINYVEVKKERGEECPITLEGIDDLDVSFNYSNKECVLYFPLLFDSDGDCELYLNAKDIKLTFLDDRWSGLVFGAGLRSLYYSFFGYFDVCFGYYPQ